MNIIPDLSLVEQKNTVAKTLTYFPPSHHSPLRGENVKSTLTFRAMTLALFGSLVATV
jgi:hypothetical protein